jgi:ATP-dependent DNA helicase RecG
MPPKPPLNLQTKIRYVKGVGPKMAALLENLDIKTVKDLIEHYPFRHEDFSQITPIGQAKPGEKLTLIGVITKIQSTYTKSPKQKTIQKATLKDNTGEINLIWFNQPFLKNTLKPNRLVSISGEVVKRGSQMQMVFPKYEIIDNKKQVSSYSIGEQSTKDTGRLVPIYPTTYGISSKYIRKLISQTLPKVKNQIKENLPGEVTSEYGLIPKKEAILNIHYPENQKELQKSKYRLGFEELFFVQLNHLIRKNNWKKKKPAPQLKKTPKAIKKFIDCLPFQLTSAQTNAIKEILADLTKPSSMNRLLQGDVGSGKTVVAAAAIIQTALNNYQSVYMAPTEILAQQHFKTLKKLLKPFKINCRLITSSTIKQSNLQPRTRANTVQGKPVTRNPQLFIGTHALIHKHAEFDQVGLVVIDEQHRFGVAQRGKLIKKAQLTDTDQLFPHVLTMTATPIPRTITLTVYGDLDVSTLNEMPAGRKPVKTFYIPNKKRTDCYQWIKKQVKKDNQGFIICPLIEESENLESVKAATDEYKKMTKKVFPELNLGLIHGRMKSSEKEKVLNQMHQGDIDILVATPVVEVGIDIPNAKFMIIETANRFGLAQLHQLRGRVGRGEEQAFCFLFADKISKKARKRLKAMESINDGLKLSEIDLKIRGPGEIYGTKQHGYPELKVADYNDLKLIETARKAAKQIIQKSPNLDKYPKLTKIVKPDTEKPIAQN